MNVGIVISGKSSKSNKLINSARIISSVLSKRGYSSDIINTSQDTDKKLILYDYLIFVSETLSFFSRKLSPALETFLKNCGPIEGKRAATLLTSSMLFKQRAMSAFMKTIESEGVILKTSLVFSSDKELSSFIETLNIERNY